MKKGYNSIATALIFVAAFILVVLGFQSLDVINITTNGKDSTSSDTSGNNGGNGGNSTNIDSSSTSQDKDSTSSNSSEDKEEPEENTITVTVDNLEKVYDGEELIPEEFTVTGDENLKTGDYIELENINKTLTNVGETTSKNEFKIYNDQGMDVTDSYDFRVTQGTLKITKAPLELTIDNNKLTKEYDGKPFTITQDDVIIDQEFASKIEVIPTLVESFTDPGTHLGTVKFNIRDNEGRNVANNFEFENNITLNVNIEKITANIVFNDVTKEYDGKELDIESFVAEKQNLLPGHKLEITSDSNLIDVTASPIELGLSYSVLDRKGEDVTDFYKFNTKTVSASILPRKVNLEFNSLIKEYDGKAFDLNSYINKISNLLPNHKLSVSSMDNTTSSIGEQSFNLTYNVIDENMNNVTDCYTFNTYRINSIITKRNVNIEFDKLEKEYDGQPFDVNDYINKTTNLLPNHTISIISKNETSNVTSSTYLDLTYHVYNEGGTEVTDCYTFNKYRVNVAIKERNVNVVFGKISKEYDGIPLNLNNFILSKSNILEGHILKVSSTADLTNVKKNAIIPVNYIVTDYNGNNVTNCYNFDTSNVNVDITPRYVSFEPNTYSKVYDGAPFKIDSHFIKTVNGSLVGGDEVSFTCNFTNKNAGIYTIPFHFSIMNAGVDVSQNYSFDRTKEFTLYIDPKEITLSANNVSQSHTYSENLFDTLPVSLQTAISNEAKSYGLTNVSFDMAKFSSMLNRVGDFNLDSSFIINSGADKDNYDIIFNKKIVINKGAATVSISNKSYTKAYDGKRFDLPLNDVVIKANGNNITDCSIESITTNDVIYKDGIVTVSNVIAKNNNDVNLKAFYNINLSAATATVKITNRDVTIVSNPMRVSYSEEVETKVTKEYVASQIYVTTASSLAEGDYIKDFTFSFDVDSDGTQKGVIITNIKIYTYSGVDVTNNYNFNKNIYAEIVRYI